MHTFFLNIAEVKILKFNFIENYQDQLFLNRGKNRTEGLKPSTVPNREILNRCSPNGMTSFMEFMSIVGICLETNINIS